jgi:hypothetical protein
MISIPERFLSPRKSRLPTTMPAPHEDSRMPKPASVVPRLSLA